MNAGRQTLLNVAEKLEEARDALKCVGATPGLPVSVTGHAVSAIRAVDQSLDSLDTAIGGAARKEHRERPREPGA